MMVLFRKTGMKGLLVPLLALLLAGSFLAGASSFVPYTTYTYSYDGEKQESPHAYYPSERYDGLRLGTGELADPSDLFVDNQTGTVYVADTGNNRILVLNREFQMQAALSSFSVPSADGGETADGTLNEDKAACI